MATGKENLFGETYIRQTLATLTVNIIVFSHGIALGWITPVLYNMQFDSEKSMLGVTITPDEISWIGSCLSLGGLTGNVLAGLLLPRIGRKRTLMILSTTLASFWVITHLVKGSKPYHFYAARFVCGINGGGCFGAIPIFISEISSPNVRGRLGSLFLITLNCGMLFGFIMTSYLPALVTPIVCGCLLIIYWTVLTIFLPETPQYFLKIGRIDEAKRSLKFYWNANDTKNLELENYFADLKQTIAPDEIKGIEGVDSKKTESVLTSILKVKSIKAILLGIGLVSVNQFSGSFSIINYSTSILERSEGFQLNINSSTILLGLLQIAGSYSATLTVDRFGRKILLLISSLSTAVGLLTAGLFDYLSYEFEVLKEYSWVLILSLCSVIYLANMGVVTVCYVVLVEILPIKIRAVATSICLVISSSLSFAQLKLFPVLLDGIQFYGLMWIFGILMTFGFLFILVFIPETKGKSLTE